MAASFIEYLAGDKAALTKALKAYESADLEAGRRLAAARAAEIINRAPSKGFTKEQVIDGRDLPQEIRSLIRSMDGGAETIVRNDDTSTRPAQSSPTKLSFSQLTEMGGRKAASSDLESTEPPPGNVSSTICHPGEMSDDCLEPETEDEMPSGAEDDNPVVSRPADWTITALREKWDSGFLDLQPSFQREYVWRLKPELPSRLIESILLEIPIPPLYFGKQAGGKLEVIDGQQRLTTLVDFVSNQFVLQRLARMPSLKGKAFRDLSREHQEKIKDTPIRTIVIDARRNAELRFEIFERLNRGSMTLNEQELRNCVYRGPFNGLLAELEKDEIWRKVKGGSDPEPRFREREMILRFFALANRGSFYKGPLKQFLNNYMEKYAPRDFDAISEQRTMFRQTMQNVWTVFGPHSGRLYSVSPGTCNGRWDSTFSIAALEIQASALLKQDQVRVQKVADQIREHFLLLLLTNEEIRRHIARATTDSAATRLRWGLFRSLIQSRIDNVTIEPRFFSYQFRKHLFDRDPSCAICGNQILNFEDSTVDHIIPYSRGGKTLPDNGQLAHRFCNASKNAQLG
jgi:Protein of unknown function DUF262/HNH endonuclease